MQKNTTQIGQVGKPTRATVANPLDVVKAGSINVTPDYFERCSEDNDDFGEMASQGLPREQAQSLRRIAGGLNGIEALMMTLRAFETERCGHEDADDADKACYTVLSPMATDGLLNATRLLADYLGREVYDLGNSLTKRAAEGGAQ